MTAIIVQGWETSRDDSDIRTKGWLPCPVTPALKKTITVPSVTGVPGYSLVPIGVSQDLYSWSSAPPGSASDETFGALNTGITVKQAWDAGGITYSFGARFNSGQAIAYGSNLNGYVFDGTLYWAIKRIGTATFKIATSPDLTNWTETPSQPAAGLNIDTCISYLGDGTIAVLPTNANVNKFIVYYTTDKGSTWLSQDFGVTTVTTTNTGVGAATGNAAFPHVFTAASYNGSTTTGQQGGIFVGKIGPGGSVAQVASVTPVGVTGVYSYTTPKVVGDLIVAPMTKAFRATELRMYWAQANSPALNTTGAWSYATVTGLSTTNTNSLADFVYHEASNQWIIVGTVGIYSAPNTGAPGTPVLPTNADLAFTQRSNQIAYKVFVLADGSLAALGANGQTFYSTNGISWTGVNHLLPTGATWIGGLYDGNRYVLFSDYMNVAQGGAVQVVAVSSDLINNYEGRYALESTEVVTQLGSGLVGAGLMVATAPPNVTTGLWVPYTTNGGFPYLVMGAYNATNGTRQWAFYNSANTSSSLMTGTLTAVPGSYHYYTMSWKAVAGSPNKFDLAFYIDGVQVASYPGYQMVTATDTTGLFVLTFQRNSTFTAFDDVLLSLDDGQGISGPQGIINIIAERTNTDVQAQWVPTATGTNPNATSVRQAALSSRSDRYVSSANAGDTDLYATTDVIPVGYTAKAVAVEGYVTQTSTSNAQVALGLKSGSATSEVTINTTTQNVSVFMSKVIDKDPATGLPWTSQAIQNSQFSLKHVS